MEKKLLLKYIKGECNEQEKVVVVNWIDMNSDNMKEYMSLRKLYDITVWQDLPKFKGISLSSKKVQRSEHWSIITLKRVSSIAAIFFLALCLGYFVSEFQLLSGTSLNKVVWFQSTAPKGEKSIVYLPDGTKVWLNSESTIFYSDNYSQGERKIKLEGEAYFDVAKVNDTPFVVQTGAMDVTVLGTKFNVYAYPDEATVSATLEEGKIVSSFSGINKRLELKPGQKIDFSLTTKTPIIRTVNTELYTSWKDNLLRFQDAQFTDVVKKMERWYDVNIQLENGLVVEKLYTMTIKTESLNEMLELLSLTAPINFKVNEDEVLITLNK